MMDLVARCAQWETLSPPSRGEDRKAAISAAITHGRSSKYRSYFRITTVAISTTPSEGFGCC